MARIAIIKKDKCKPDKCGFVCQRVCPIVMSGGTECVTKGEDGKARIDERMCSGCGICVKHCPFNAVQIINLPSVINKPPIHQYGENGFRIFGLPILQENKITGIIGRNGIGKSTVINILSGYLRANFGESKELSDEEYFSKLNEFFKGTVLQSYFLKLKNNEITVSYKPQHILKIAETFSGKVKDLLLKVNSEEEVNKISEEMELNEILDRDIKNLSGGELQRVAVAATLLKSESTLFVFDEISNYMDVYHRLNTSKIIKERVNTTGLVVEHDLVVLDYLVEYVHIMYGVPGGYGNLTGIKSARNGINDYLYGYSKEENLRFRDKPIIFTKDSVKEFKKSDILADWKDIEIDRGEFKLKVIAGNLMTGEILGVMGRNGLGKSTFVSYIAEKGISGKELKISYKPQLIPQTDELVMSVLAQYDYFNDSFYKVYVLDPLSIKDILEKPISALSGGELQRFAIAKTLLSDADIYLLDEPTAFLDIEDRLKVSKVLRNFIEVKKKTAMIVDHDIVFMDYLSDRLLVFTGKPSKEGLAHAPLSMRDGMNLFLKEIGVTFRRDENNKRPRVNKLGSVKDIEQKKKNEYYYV